MFNLILSPVLSAVRSWMANATYHAAQEGAREGLAKFAAQLSAQLELPAPAPERPLAIPMPSAAQVTDADDEPCPAEDVTKFEQLKELIAHGMSQREAARQLGIPESTARGWIRRAEGG